LSHETLAPNDHEPFALFPSRESSIIIRTIFRKSSSTHLGKRWRQTFNNNININHIVITFIIRQHEFYHTICMSYHFSYTSM